MVFVWHHVTHKCPKNTFNIVTDCDTKVFPFKCFCVSLPLHLSTVPKWRRCTGAASRRSAGRPRAADSRFHSAEVAAVGPGLTVRAPLRAHVSRVLTVNSRHCTCARRRGEQEEAAGRRSRSAQTFPLHRHTRSLSPTQTRAAAARNSARRR